MWTKILSETTECKAQTTGLNGNENTILELKPCPICNRKFNIKTHNKHVSICSTTASKKRKVFDSSRQRREGTELSSYIPKNFGLPVTKNHDRPLTSKPVQIVYPPRKEEIEVKESQNNLISVESNFVNFVQSKSIKKSKRTRPPPSEQCPHCERFFGTKAYDRHVEWCREKAMQQAIKCKGSNNDAMDRLHARIKYRAPCLRSKRTLTREKYSPTGILDEDEKFRQKKSSEFMSSSNIVDNNYSSCYDPFMSAKRQFEELSSSTLTNKSGFDNSPPLQTNNRNSNALSNTAKINIHRTHSLRTQRKIMLLPPRTVFPSSHTYRPTVQSGLSDEGPISTSFLKTEEYDEMPVRSVCQNNFATKITPRIVKRDCISSSRRNISLPTEHITHLYSQEMEIGLLPEKKSSLDKAESPSIFLKLEREPNNQIFHGFLTAKELKNKNNAINKKTSSKELSLRNGNTSHILNNLPYFRLDPIEKPSNDVFNQKASVTCNSAIENKEITDLLDSKLINISDNLSVKVEKPSDSDIITEISSDSGKKYDPSNRYSANGKNLRTRKMILDRNQFLFDVTPDTSNISFQSTEIYPNLPKITQLEDFDFHEFLSKFSNDEKELPLFKGCQEFLSIYLNQQQNMEDNVHSLIDSWNHSMNTEKGDELKCKPYKDIEKELGLKGKGEIFICIETDQNENDFDHPAKDNPHADNPTTQILDAVDNSFFKIEDEGQIVKRNNDKNIKEAHSYHSVQDCDTREVQAKRSSDSAYGR
ncbi:hypothetical protein ACFFRR_001027 [Megaselia abdita]